MTRTAALFLTAALTLTAAMVALAPAASAQESEAAQPREEPPAVGEPAAEPQPPEKLRMMRELLKLRGRDYREARGAVLRTVKAEDIAAIRDSEEAGDDPALRLVCDALIWRLGNARTAELLDKHAADPTGSGAAAPEAAGGEALWAGRDAAQVLVSCFGPGALPALVEQLVYEDRPAVERLTVIEALVELRDARTPDVLLAAAGDQKLESRVRAAAVWRLEKCLSGVPALAMAHAVGKDPLGLGPRVAPELADLARAVKLPALELKGAARDRVVNGLAKFLAWDRDDRVRALAAKALRGAGDAAVGQLVRSLSTDASPWVRAWCADSLRRLGTPEAKKALAAARGAEKNPEVQGIIDGRGAPALPEQAVPGKSILRGR